MFTRLHASCTELRELRIGVLIFISQIAITQSISGTGALRIGGEFFARFYPGAKAIYLPTPTWGNHIPIMKDSGLEVKSYAYYDKKTVGLDFEGMKRDMRVRLSSSIIDFSEKGCSVAGLLISNFANRLRRMDRSSCSMLAPTTPPESTRPRSNGWRLPPSARFVLRPSSISLPLTQCDHVGEGPLPVHRSRLPRIRYRIRRARCVRSAIFCRAGNSHRARSVLCQEHGSLR